MKVLNLFKKKTPGLKSLQKQFKHAQEVASKEIEKSQKQLSKGLHKSERVLKNRSRRLQAQSKEWLAQITPQQFSPQPVKRSSTKYVLGMLGTVLGLIAVGGVSVVAANRLRNRQAVKKTDLRPYPGLNLEKFSGQWYEIARFENSKKGKVAGMKVDYSLKSNQDLEVTYTYYKEHLEGQAKTSSHTLKVPDSNQNARLVKKQGLTETNYWILEVGDQYNYAVIATPAKDHLWILSRKPQMNDELYDKLIAQLELQGFATDKLHKVPQAEGESLPLHVHLQDLQNKKEAYFKGPEHEQNHGPNGNHRFDSKQRMKQQNRKIDRA